MDLTPDPRTGPTCDEQVKFYYTIRELTNHVVELYVLVPGLEYP